MRFFILAYLLLSAKAAFSSGMNIPIQARAAVEFWYNEFNSNDVKLINPNDLAIEVSIVDTNSLKAIETFNLDANPEVTFSIANACMLKLYNASDNKGEVMLEFVSRDEDVLLKTTSGEKVKLVLANTTKKEFVLILPSGSKPKLGPGSRTGLFFKMGDEVFFLKENKEILLFKVDDTFKNGQELNINKMAKVSIIE